MSFIALSPSVVLGGVGEGAVGGGGGGGVGEPPQGTSFPFGKKVSSETISLAPPEVDAPLAM